MKTIKENCNNEIIIKKSKFITYLYRINDFDDIKEILNQTKKNFSNASHICYAYILNGNYKSNDDNEPNGTAGMPMLDILCKRNLEHILVITIRYFGGIKLGAGGLIRAYSKSVREALNKVQEVEMINTDIITVICNTNNLKLAQTILKNYEIIEKNFSSIITFQVLVATDKKEELIAILKKNNFQIKM